MLIKNKKGVVRVIEAFLASMLLMTCLALIPAPPNIQDSSSELPSMAQNVLLSLDSNGQIARLVDNRDWTDLAATMNSAFPITVWFNLTVFDENMHPLNPSPISNGGPVSNKIVSINYVCATESSNYTIYTLQLQLSAVGSL